MYIHVCECICIHKDIEAHIHVLYRYTHMRTVMLLFCVQCVCVKAGVDVLVQNVQRVLRSHSQRERLRERLSVNAWTRSIYMQCKAAQWLLTKPVCMFCSRERRIPSAQLKKSPWMSM